MEKRQLKAKEFLEDIRSGMSDPELMKKHALSDRGLRSAVSKLVAAGLLKQAELDERMSSHERTVKTVWKCPACGKPQSREFEDCPECGILVAKFKEYQEIKEKRAEAQRLQEEAERARQLEQERQKKEDVRLTKLTISALKGEHESVPADFKKELYPGLMFLVAVGNAIAQWGAIVFVILTLAGTVMAIVSGQLLVGVSMLLGGLLIAGLIWIVYKTYSESIQVFLDVSTSLVKNNVLLARILERTSGQDA